MTTTENTSLNSLNAVDISSQDDLNKWKSYKPVHTYRDKHVSFVCNECHKIKTLRLRAIQSYPVICRSCRLKHRYDDPHYIEKMKQTNLKRYGVEFNSQTQSWKDSIIKTSIEKYGVEHFSYAKSVREKCRETTLKHFDGIGFACAELRDKQRATMIEKYDAYHNMVSPTLKTQFFDAMTDKYGGIGNAVPSIAKKQKATLVERYGTTVIQNVPEIMEKCKKKYRYSEQWFDSLPEIQYYKELVASGVSFEYHPKTYFTYEYDGKTHYYHPDFYVNGEFVELKGPQFFNNRNGDNVNLDDPTTTMINPYNRKYNGLAQAKYECMKRNNIKIIITKPIQNRNSYIRDNNITAKSHHFKKDQS